MGNGEERELLLQSPSTGTKRFGSPTRPRHLHELEVFVKSGTSNFSIGLEYGVVDHRFLGTQRGVISKRVSLTPENEAEKGDETWVRIGAPPTSEGGGSSRSPESQNRRPAGRTRGLVLQSGLFILN